VLTIVPILVLTVIVFCLIPSFAEDPVESHAV